MLIVAMPKSASSSLVSTLGSIHGFPTRQLKFGHLPIPAKTRYLGQVHSDFRDLSSDEVSLFARRDVIYKQHIPPTPNNLELLEDIRKVILLRNPAQVVSAYRRAKRRLGMHYLPGLDQSLDAQEWQQGARQVGLLDDLTDFHQRWMRHADASSLIVMYKELMADPTGVIRAIEAFMGLPPVEQRVTLDKKRYSRSTVYAIRWATQQSAKFLLKKIGVCRGKDNRLTTYDPNCSGD